MTITRWNPEVLPTMPESRPDAEDVSLEAAIDRWLRKRQTDATEETLRGYRSRMTQFLK